MLKMKPDTRAKLEKVLAEVGLVKSSTATK
jgi:hypothetical protein